MKNIKIKSNKNQQKGEIVTVVTLGSLLIIGFASLLSSVFLQKPNTTNTKAQTVNDLKCPGKMDVSGACNPACCSQDFDPKNPDANCPSGQTCTHANGYCAGGTSGQFSCEPKGSKGKSICT
ncbi:MAG: hypothetical protein Q7R95_01460, partial [bacterium]|nr:hypothetical protein [bacterium]